MCVCVHAKSLQSCATLYDCLDSSPPGFSVLGILRARILEWVAMPSSRGSSPPGIESASLMSPALTGGFFTTTLVPHVMKCGSPGFDPWVRKSAEDMATHSSLLAWRIPMGRGAWQVAVHRDAKSQTQLGDSAQHSTWELLLNWAPWRLRQSTICPVRETQVRSLGWEEPLKKGMATHPSILFWRTPWTKEPGRLQGAWWATVHGVTKNRT